MIRQPLRKVSRAWTRKSQIISIRRNRWLDHSLSPNKSNRMQEYTQIRQFRWVCSENNQTLFKIVTLNNQITKKREMLKIWNLMKIRQHTNTILNLLPNIADFCNLLWAKSAILQLHNPTVFLREQRSRARGTNHTCLLIWIKRSPRSQFKILIPRKRTELSMWRLVIKAKLLVVALEGTPKLSRLSLMIEAVIWVTQVTTAREKPDPKRENLAGKYPHSLMQRLHPVILLKADPEPAPNSLYKKITQWGKKYTKIWGVKFHCSKNKSLTIFHKRQIMLAFQSWRV